MSDHLRIAFVITRSDTLGGAHIHVRDLATALQQAGHRVRVLVGGSGYYVEHLRELGVDVVPIYSLTRRLAPCQDLRALQEIRQRLRQYQPDLVSTHSSKAGWLGRVLARRLDLPVLFTAHGWSFTPGVPQPARTVYALAEFVASRFATLIVTVSEYDRELALRWRVAPPDRMTTVHNGVVDVEKDFLAEPGAIPPMIAMTARLGEQKDHATLFYALAQLPDRSYRVELIGDGPRQQHLRVLAHRLGIGSRIDFLGLQSDVRSRLASAQVFTLISNWEGFPRSVIEAMRAGLPIVASDVGGISESVTRGHSGYLCARGDVDGVRDSLARLLDDPPLRQRMGQAGRERYQELFTFDRLFVDTLAVYKSLASERGTTSRTVP